MTYSPDPSRHTELADTAALWCSADETYCTADDPCPCDVAGSGEEVAAPAAVDEAPVKIAKATGDMAPPPAKDQAPRPVEVKMVGDGDAGEAGESHG